MRCLTLVMAGLLCGCATQSAADKPNIRRSLQLKSARQIPQCSADEITVDLTPLIIASRRSSIRPGHGRRGLGQQQPQQWTAFCKGQRYRCRSAAAGDAAECREAP